MKTVAIIGSGFASLSSAIELAALGYNEFLKQMEELASQQRELNNQSSQLALGQLTASMQESMMEQMLFQ